MRVFETQEMGCFTYVVTVHQEILALLYHERMYIADSRAAGSFMDDIAQIAG